MKISTLTLCLTTSAFVSMTVAAAPIVIPTGSFESPALPDGVNNQGSGVTDWSKAGRGRTSHFIGTGPTLDAGAQFGFLNPNVTGEQALTDTYAANTTYTYSGYHYGNGSSDFVLTLGYDNGGGFVELDTVTSLQSALTAGEWSYVFLDYTTGSTGDEIGENIIVQIAGAGANGGAWFDVIELDAAPVPEPTSLALLSMGGLFMLRRRRD